MELEMFSKAHRLSLGTSGLAGLFRPVPEVMAENVLAAAWDHGIRYFDTAPHYGNGMAEHRLGRFLRGRKDWILSTKVGRVLSPHRNPPDVINGFHNSLPFRQEFDFSYDGIMRSVEGSFNRLGLNRIDVVYVHDIGEPRAGTDTPEHRNKLLESGARALEELKASDEIRAIGLGVNTVEICIELAGRIPIDLILLAGRYTLLDQSAKSRLFPLCHENNINLVIGGVFNSGILATGPVEGAHFDYAPAPSHICKRVEQIEEICTRHEVPLAAAALQFPDRNPLVVSTLIGTAKINSLNRNVEQFSSSLPKALWNDLRAEGFIGTDQ